MIEKTTISGICDGCEKPFSVEAGSKEAVEMKQANVDGKNLIFHGQKCYVKWMAEPEIIIEEPKAKPKKKR